MDSEKVELLVKKPKASDMSASKLYANKVAARLLNNRDDNGRPIVILRANLEKLREELGIWSKEKDKELEELDDSIINTTRSLTNGGRMSKSQGKELAFKLKELRMKKFELLRESRQLDELTLEAQTENENFDYLCSLCILDEEGKRKFDSVEEYKEHADEPEVFNAAAKLASMLFEYDENKEKELPENKFLIKYGFVNNELRFVNKDGELTDSEGKKVDVNRRYVNEAGEYVNKNGERVDEDGNLLENITEIVDDE